MATPRARMHRVNFSMSWSDWGWGPGCGAHPPRLPCPPRLATCGPELADEQATASMAAAARAVTSMMGVAPMTAPRGRARPGGRGTAVPPEGDLWRFIVGLQSLRLRCLPAGDLPGAGVHGPNTIRLFPAAAAPRGAGQAGAAGRHGIGRVMRMWSLASQYGYVRVLIVEDQPTLADDIADGLRDQGMAADVAYDGASGLDKALMNQYDVVIVDRDLPKIHGDAVCAALIGARS